MNLQALIIEETPESRFAEFPSDEMEAGIPVLTRHTPLKAIGDFVAAILLLIPSLPLMALSMALVKLTSRGPALYSQTRLGRDGRPFKIYKIRSMVVDSEAAGPRWSTEGDPRVTPIGRFLRRSHLDELPQLWNILKGEMSLVGPRPERPEFVQQLELAMPRYRQRLTVRPGVTGLAQVQLPPDTDLSSVRRKLECDLRYIGIMGPWLDLRIIACTAFGLLGIPHSISRKVLRIPSLDESSEIASQLQPARV
jgi:lipopolysaccharide/colanic/teichoic acid biosynthesis glycosyltransferase